MRLEQNQAAFKKFWAMPNQADAEPERKIKNHHAQNQLNARKFDGQLTPQPFLGRHHAERKRERNNNNNNKNTFGSKRRLFSRLLEETGKGKGAGQARERHCVVVLLFLSLSRSVLATKKLNRAVFVRQTRTTSFLDRLHPLESPR